MATRKAFNIGNDAFDSLDWDPDLPSAKALDESPEPVPIKPQPVAYTTVGSLVNPNSLPQLSAPHRIQREGANRRPLMSILQGLQSSLPQRRGPPPPLNMSNSMHYAQQVGARSAHSESVSTFPRPSRDISSIGNPPQEQSISSGAKVGGLTLSQQEKEILMMHYGTYAVSGDPSPLKPSAIPQISRHQLFNVREFEEEARARSGNGMQGLEKMQTLQRLAKFPNPAQQHARNRLSEFSIAMSQNSMANPLGELNREYQFPSQPAGFAATSLPQSNPLLGAADRAYSGNPPSTRPPGYPQPLTAGPPGQRQAPPSSIIATLDQQNDIIQAAEWEEHEWCNSLGSHQPANPWAYQQGPQKAGSNTHGVPTARLDRNNKYVFVPVEDTLHPSQAMKYYPTGFPMNLTDNYTPLPDDMRLNMDNASLEDMDEEKASNVEEMRNKLFYYGQRRFWGLTVDDHILELKIRSEARDSAFGAIAPPPRQMFTEPVIPAKVTVREMNEMSLGEAVAPLLEAALGTMLALHDKGIGSAGALSNFGDCDPEWIDSEPKAATSLFGEDWGRTSKTASDRISLRSKQR